MKTLNKFLSAALAVGLVVAPLAVNAEGYILPEIYLASATTEVDCLNSNNPGSEHFDPRGTFVWTPGAAAVPEVPAIPAEYDYYYDADGQRVPDTSSPTGYVMVQVRPLVPAIPAVPAQPGTCRLQPHAAPGVAGNVTVPGNPAASGYTSRWNGGIATARAEREALNTAVAAARAAIAAGNDGIRGAAEIDFNFGWIWTHGGATSGNFFLNNVGENCSARLTEILDRYSTDNQGRVNPDYLLAEQLYIQNRYIGAALMTQQQFANNLFNNTARVDGHRPNAILPAGRNFTAIVPNPARPIPANQPTVEVQSPAHLNGYAFFNANNAWASTQQTERFVVFAEGTHAIQGFDFYFVGGVGSGSNNRGAVRSHDVRDVNSINSRTARPTGNVDQFAQAQYDLELANFITRAARYQLEEVLVKDCGVDIASNPNATQPATTAPATTAPATTAPGATTGGGSQATLPQTNTAVVATGLAGVGVTGLGAVAAFLKNKKA